MREDRRPLEGDPGETAGVFAGGQVREDLTAISEQELGVLLEKLVSEEREISYRRRVLQGKIDLVRAELVRRGGVTISPEELARVLIGESVPRPEEDVDES